MAKKRPKNDHIATAKAELTELHADDVDKLADGIEEIVRRLRTIGQNMRANELAIQTKGMATWPKIRARLSGATRSVEIAWDKANIPKTVAKKREKFESSGDK
jgi:hypothetical protein